MCWAQEKLEFLCERDKAAHLMPDERIALHADWTRFHVEFKDEVISERCLKADYSSRAAFADWLQCATDHGFVPSPAATGIVAGRLTFANKAGLLPTTGLNCMCCAGYRVWAALVIGAALGWLL
jgi:hypothetical protein